MINDAQLIFGQAWAPTAIGANLSPNVYDTTQARDLGVGMPLVFVVQVVTTVTSAGAPTLDFQLQQSAVSAMTSPTTILDPTAGVPIALAALVAGLRYQVPLTRTFPAPGMQEFLGVNAQIATAVLTAGAFDVFLTLGGQDRTIYKSGFTIK